jgi:hypothetical protein
MFRESRIGGTFAVSNRYRATDNEGFTSPGVIYKI